MEWSALVGFAGVALGWLVAWLQQKSARREAERVRQDDRQARAEEWLRNARLSEYSMLLPILRGLPMPEKVLALSKDEAVAQLATARLEIDQRLVALSLLVDEASVEPGIEVQGAVLRYIDRVKALPEPLGEGSTDARRVLDDLYESYENSWGVLVDLMRSELGVHERSSRE